MDPQRDIERVLNAWFVDGSSQMPDRFFDAVLDEVGRMPQRRRPWSNLRVRPMSLQVRLAAPAAVIILIRSAGPPSSPAGRPPRIDVSPSPW